jgi:predicted  nucleic acid-binding Zn-ribbon protein
MRRLAAGALLVLPLLAGCGSEDALDPAAAEQLEQARVDADEAMDAVRDLRSRIAELEDELSDSSASASDAGHRLDEVTDRLWASLRKIREQISGVRSDAGDASSEAAQALSEAVGAAKDLSVLQERFDYHLEHDHGGG